MRFAPLHFSSIELDHTTQRFTYRQIPFSEARLMVAKRDNLNRYSLSLKFKYEIIFDEMFAIQQATFDKVKYSEDSFVLQFHNGIVRFFFEEEMYIQINLLKLHPQHIFFSQMLFELLDLLIFRPERYKLDYMSLCIYEGLSHLYLGDKYEQAKPLTVLGYKQKKNLVKEPIDMRLNTCPYIFRCSDETIDSSPKKKLTKRKPTTVFVQKQISDSEEQTCLVNSTVAETIEKPVYKSYVQSQFSNYAENQLLSSDEQRCEQIMEDQAFDDLYNDLNACIAQEVAREDWEQSDTAPLEETYTELLTTSTNMPLIDLLNVENLFDF